MADDEDYTDFLATMAIIGSDYGNWSKKGKYFVHRGWTPPLFSGHFFILFLFFCKNSEFCSNNGHGIRVVPAKELVASLAKDEECVVSIGAISKTDKFHPGIFFLFSPGAKVHARPLIDQRA